MKQKPSQGSIKMHSSQPCYSFDFSASAPFGKTSISRHGSFRNSHIKWHLSLPKNGSSLPSPFLTHIHGAPNAPSSSTFFILAVKLSFHSFWNRERNIRLRWDPERGEEGEPCGCKCGLGKCGLDIAHCSL
jgi:hypothetical protein